MNIPYGVQQALPKSSYHGVLVKPESCSLRWERLVDTAEDFKPLMYALATAYNGEIHLNALDCMLIACHCHRGYQQTIEEFEKELQQHIQERLEYFRTCFMNERMPELNGLTPSRRQYRTKSLTGGANTHKQNCLVQALKKELPIIWSWNTAMARAMLQLTKLYERFNSVYNPEIHDPNSQLGFWLRTNENVDFWNEVRSVERKAMKGLEDIEAMGEVARSEKQQAVFNKIRKEKPGLANIDSISDMPDHIKKNISANGSNAARSARLDALKLEFHTGMMLQRKMSLKIQEAMHLVLKTRNAFAWNSASVQCEEEVGITSDCTPCA